MTFEEYLNEGKILDFLKKKLGAVKGKIVSSMTNLLSIFKKDKNALLTTIETFNIPQIGDIEARVDTGALKCSIHAVNIKKEDDGTVTFDTVQNKKIKTKLIGIQTVKSATGTTERMNVKLDISWNKKLYKDVLFNIADRSKLTFGLLIGRNLIADLKLPVHINQKDMEEKE